MMTNSVFLFLAFISTPLYPGTGSPQEKLAQAKARASPLMSSFPRVSGDAELINALNSKLVKAMDEFQAGIYFSFLQGFDGHQADPLGGLALYGERIPRGG